MFKNSRLFFWTVELLAVTALIYLLSQIQFIFYPLGVLIAQVFMPLLVAGFLYYAFSPLIRFLSERCKMHKNLAISLVFVLLVGGIALLISSFLPNVIKQLSGLIVTSAKVFPQLTDWLERLAQNELVRGVDIEGLVNKVNLSYTDILQNILNGVTFSLSNVIQVVSQMMMVVVLAPILLFYMLKDGHKLLPYVKKHYLKSDRLKVLDLLKTMNKTISSYISGAAIDCLIIFVSIFLAYQIAGIPYAFLFGVFAGITNLIPYLGPWIGVAPVVLTVVFDDWKQALLAIVISQAIQWVDGNFIYPRVVGSAVNVHPVTITILMLVAGSLYGLVGMVIAVPLYSLVKEIVKFGQALYDNHHKRLLAGKK